MTIDQRLEALTMNLELMSHRTESNSRDIGLLKTLIEQDAENIRALARVAEIHEHRVTNFEDGQR